MNDNETGCLVIIISLFLGLIFWTTVIIVVWHTIKVNNQALGVTIAIAVIALAYWTWRTK
jgi:protein-S-isoprenylcysteine O-methyltransferase Ste14